MYHSTNDAEQKACHMPYRRIPSQKSIGIRCQMISAKQMRTVTIESNITKIFCYNDCYLIVTTWVPAKVQWCSVAAE